MTSNTSKRYPLVQKAAFGSGHLVNNLLPGALGVFSFLFITALVYPCLAGLLSAIPRLFDAFRILLWVLLPTIQ